MELNTELPLIRTAFSDTGSSSIAVRISVETRSLAHGTWGRNVNRHGAVVDDSGHLTDISLWYHDV